MANEPNEDLKSKFGSSLLAGAQGLNKNPVKKKAPEVRIARSTYANMTSTKLLKAIGYSLLALIVVYFAFAVTIMRVLPTTSAGLVPVKNITFDGGLIPAGELIVVDMKSSHGKEIQDYFLQSVTPNGNVSVVKALAGPWGTFGWADPGIIALDGEIVPNVFMDQPESLELKNQYLVECIKGACESGVAYVIPAKNIMGAPLGGN